MAWGAFGSITVLPAGPSKLIPLSSASITFIRSGEPALHALGPDVEAGVGHHRQLTAEIRGVRHLGVELVEEGLVGRRVELLEVGVGDRDPVPLWPGEHLVLVA